jgi:hypothetical protein
MTPSRERLLLVSNLLHEDRQEDLFLADRLSDNWEVALASPAVAIDLLSTRSVQACLIRNAWPSREFHREFGIMESLSHYLDVDFYNPFAPGCRGPVENKTYLHNLFQQQCPVIPSFLDAGSMLTAGHDKSEVILAKPIAGCSSEGIVQTLLGEAPPGAYIYQPVVAFSHEESFYFIDGEFAYAMKSSGPSMENRWDLTEFTPTAEDVAWAARFVAWNRLPYGLQRIDACRLKEGASLLLMEIEDSMPWLSLFDLSEARRERVVDLLKGSLYQNLSRDRPSLKRAKSMGRRA